MKLWGNSFDTSKLSAELLSILTADDSNNTLFNKALQFLLQALRGTNASLILKQKGKLEVVESMERHCFGFSEEEYRPLLHWFMEHQGILQREDLSRNPDLHPIRDVGLKFFVHFQGEMVAPIFSHETLVGFLSVGRKQDEKRYTKSEREFLQWFTTMMGVSFVNFLLKEKLAEQKREVSAVKRMKNDILSNLSHEMRTPLTGIMGFGEILADGIDGPLNPSQQKSVEEILRGSKKLLKVITALVDLAKLESEKHTLEITSIHLTPFLRELAEGVRAFPDTQVTIEIPEGLPIIYGDVGSVRQIFQQVLDNAVKYTPRGSITVSAERTGEMLTLCVRDTGIGIGPENLRRIFEDFFQVDSGLARKYEGSGVGLALTRRLVELHGGRIWAKSVLGKGSRLYFTLPMKPVLLKVKALAA